MSKPHLVLPRLYDRNSKGTIKEWEIAACPTAPLDTDPRAPALIVTTFGQQGKTMQVQEKQITTGKNLGRSNETTPYEQAVNEARSTWQKKKDKGYTEDLASLQDGSYEPPKLPMLAHPFQDRKHDISWPAVVQPKLNGVRCEVMRGSQDTVLFMSRKGKFYTTLNHLTAAGQKMLNCTLDYPIDGEIYVHGWDFQDIVRAVKKYRPGVSEQLQFHAYDLGHPADDYRVRAHNLAQATALAGPEVQLVPAYLAQHEDEVKLAHDRFVADGYEGVIIRNLTGPYAFRDRSKDLQKYKEFIDEEFEIVDGYPGTGTDAGCVNFTVRNHHRLTTAVSETFNVRPRGTVEKRQRWLAELDQLIGKQLTVRYMELSKDGVPMGNTVGLEIRDYE